MSRTIWLLVGLVAGAVALGPLQARSEAGTGPATIRVTDRQLSAARVDIGRKGTSPGDVEVVRARLLERGTLKPIGTSELVCTFVDNRRARVCRGTLLLPRGKIVVGGSLEFRQLYDLAVVGGTGLYDNARGSMTVTRISTRPVRNMIVVRLVG